MNAISDLLWAIHGIRNNEDHQINAIKFDKSTIKLLEDTSKNSNLRDDFDAFNFPATQTCFLKSQKTECNYYFSYDIIYNEISFYTYISNWENIKNIDDTFWIELVELSKKMNITFDSIGPKYDKSKTPEFNSKFKSIIFNIMSVYVTSMLELKSNRSCINFGSLNITWAVDDIVIADMIDELNSAFKVFYRFNYLLWKIENVRKQNRANRNKKK